MIGKELKDSRYATVSEVADIMESREKDGYLGFEQQATLDYSKKFRKLALEKAKQMMEELSEVKKLTPEAKVRITDILPKSREQLSIILAKERFTLTKDETQEVLKIVEKYA